MLAVGQRRRVGLVLASLLAACNTSFLDGQFQCVPDEPGTCPPGLFCQVRGDVAEFRCYETPSDAYCGNGVLDPGEECDGSYWGDAACASRGYWSGQLACSNVCRLQGESCRGLTALTLGHDFGCGLEPDGTAWCWGANSRGQLGDSTFVDHTNPAVVASAVPFAAVAASWQWAAGLDSSGAAWWWGSVPHSGGTVNLQTYPTRVAEGPFASLAAGDVHACALDGAGQAFCWGEGWRGQLGDGSKVEFTGAPVAVSGGHAFVEIGAGQANVCARDADGGVWCWGAGALGYGGTSSVVPTRIAGDRAYSVLAVGERHACALDLDQQAWCWGANEHGQLGDGTKDRALVPVRVAAGQRFSAIASGFDQTIALDSRGSAWAWGRGPLGDGSPADGVSPIPVAVSHEEPFVRLATRFRTICAVTENGRPLCWGWNGAGQTGTDALPLSPLPVAAATAFVQITTSNLHTCALTAAGASWCWGWNYNEQLGDGSMITAVTPVATRTSVQLTQLAAGAFTTCALDPAGQVYCWGNMIDTSFISSLPKLTAAGHRFRALVSGPRHLCGLDDASAAWCWGYNAYGQLGDGSMLSRDDPVAVQGGHAFDSLAVGLATTCGIDGAERAWCWGLVDAANGVKATAPQLVVDQPLVAVAVGTSSACALDPGGQAWCWGLNTDGRLGTGTTLLTTTTPIPVHGGIEMQKIVAGMGHVCALDFAGRAWCWGENDHGQLGDGTRRNLSVPSPVATDRAFVQLAAGMRHTCGLDAQGAAQCWGANDSGQLGADTFVLVPTRVAAPAEPR